MTEQQMTDLEQRVVDAAWKVWEAETELQEAVDALRADGTTWKRIGEVLGITKQAAWKRFAR